MLLALLVVGMFVPGWVREYNAKQTQRNAIRLQQTIRALAETCERPDVVEMEANARTVRAQRRELRRATRAEIEAERERARLEAERIEREAELERERARLAHEQAEQELREQRLREETWRSAALLREQELQTEREQAEAAMADAQARQQASARARAAAQEALAREAAARGDAETAQARWANGASGAQRAIERRATGEIFASTPDARVEAAARRRRGRLASTVTGALGIVLGFVGAIVLGSGVIGFALLLTGLFMIGGAAWMLQRIHRVAQAALAEPAVATVAPDAVPDAAVAEPVAEPVIVHDIEPMVAEPEAEPENGWTPVKLPKPLYLERATSDELDPTDPDGPGGGDDFDHDLAALLHAEAQRSTEALRQAHREVESDRFGFETVRAQRVGAITVGSEVRDRLQHLDELAAEAGDCSDLDAVLRRRRAS